MIKKLIGVCFISCFFLEIAVANSDQKQLNSKTPLIRELKELLQDNPKDFYKKAISLRKQEIKQEAYAIDFFLLFSDYYFHVGSYDSVVWSLNQADQLLKNEDDNRLVQIFLKKSWLYQQISNIDSLIFYHGKAAELVDESSDYYGVLLLIDALINSFNSDHVLSVEKVLKAIPILEKLDDKTYLAIAYNDLANEFSKIGDRESEFQYLLKALELNKELKNSRYLAMNYNNLGIHCKLIGKLDEAILYYDSALIHLNLTETPLLIAQNMTNRANIYEKKGDLDKAGELFLQCYIYCEKNKIVYGQMLSSLNLGNLFRQQRKFGLADERLLEAEKLSKVLKTRREQALVYERRFWLERDRGNFEYALEAQSKFHSLNDSLINESVKKEANALREKYEVEKKENEIISLSQDKLYQQIALILLSTGILVLILIIQWWRLKHDLIEKEKQNERLQRDHLKVLIQNKDQELNIQASQLVHMQNQLLAAKMKISNILHSDTVDNGKFQKIEAVLNGNPLEGAKMDLDNRISAGNEVFFQRLLKEYPDLSPAELKLCAYLKLNMPTKDIADLLNRSVRTIETTRSNIRKKLNLEGNDNLVSYLIRLATE